MRTRIDEPPTAKQNVLQDEKQDQSDGKAPWVNLFEDNRSIDEGFKFCSIDDRPDEIVLEEGDVDNVEQAWGFCLVGYFAGRFPGKAALLRLCDSWKVDYQFFVHASGWLIFRFENEASRASVLHGGP